MQKRIGVKIKTHHAAMLVDVHAVHGFNRRFGLAFCCPKAGKIMLTHQAYRCLLHCINTQFTKSPTDLPCQYHRTHRFIAQNITVSAAISIKTGAEFRRHFISGLYCNAAGQMRIHTAHPSRQRPLCGGVKMHHLRRGMHASVGAASHDGGHRMQGNLAQSLF